MNHVRAIWTMNGCENIAVDLTNGRKDAWDDATKQQFQLN